LAQTGCACNYFAGGGPPHHPQGRFPPCKSAAILNRTGDAGDPGSAGAEFAMIKLDSHSNELALGGGSYSLDGRRRA
jgi:hypothetical protein